MLCLECPSDAAESDGEGCREARAASTYVCSANGSSGLLCAQAGMCGESLVRLLRASNQVTDWHALLLLLVGGWSSAVGLAQCIRVVCLRLGYETCVRAERHGANQRKWCAVCVWNGEMVKWCGCPLWGSAPTVCPWGAALHAPHAEPPPPPPSCGPKHATPQVHLSINAPRPAPAPLDLWALLPAGRLPPGWTAPASHGPVKPVGAPSASKLLLSLVLASAPGKLGSQAIEPQL